MAVTGSPFGTDSLSLYMHFLNHAEIKTECKAGWKVTNTSKTQCHHLAPAVGSLLLIPEQQSQLPWLLPNITNQEVVKYVIYNKLENSNSIRVRYQKLQSWMPWEQDAQKGTRAESRSKTMRTISCSRVAREELNAISLFNFSVRDERS